MKNLIVAVVVCALIGSEAVAGPFGLVRRSGRNAQATTTTQPAAGTTYYQNYDGELHSCQGVANRMARMLRMAHLGNPTGGYEGVGMASTPQAAIQNCCFYGRRPLRDSGVAQGANGMWYACCRYN